MNVVYILFYYIVVFDYLEYDGYENIVFVYDMEIGLKVVIVVYSMVFGFVLGGCRMWFYDMLFVVLNDVMCFFRGMIYKNVFVDFDFGGGKVVIIVDLYKDKLVDLMEVFGRYVDCFFGVYIIVEDVGILLEDMEVVVCQINYVCGIQVIGFGDFFFYIVFGVFVGIWVLVKYVFGSDDLEGKIVFV